MSARERTAAHRSDESLAYGCCDAVTEPLTTYCADSWRVRASTGRARSELSPTARGVQCAVTKSIIVQRQKAAACGRVCGVLKASTRAHMYRDSREQQCSCQYSLHRRGAAAEPLAWSSRESSCHLKSSWYKSQGCSQGTAPGALCPRMRTQRWKPFRQGWPKGAS